jgi:adenosylcobyric acid synthase
MIQGTASSVGKSIVTAALCRHLRQQGLRVAPFKAQNMALNAAVTPSGGEIGRAQAVQALAAGVVPTVDMNPILLKPEGDARAQVVVLGKPVGSVPAFDFHSRKPELREIVCAALDRLRTAYDVVVIEGAGSPAEVNLKSRDLVNMFVARVAEAPVVLVGDIDRGGVFAAFVGTMELLEPDERARVGAFLINKFRGDITLLEPGLQFLEQRTGVPVLGVMPYVPRLRIPDEDSVSLDDRKAARTPDGDVVVAVIRLPRIANYDDFQPLEYEAGVSVRFVEHVDEMTGADLVVLPGTKSTAPDLQWLRQSGFADAVQERARRGEPLLGICGGCQMLGGTIADPEGVESGERSTEGLGLLPLRTEFGRDKRTAQVRARVARTTFLAEAGEEVAGFEIHMGRTIPDPGQAPLFSIASRNGAPDEGSDGAVGSGGTVIGTMLHGLFENASVRSRVVRTLRTRKGLAPLSRDSDAIEDPFDQLADVLRRSIKIELLNALLGAPAGQGIATAGG